MLRLVCAEESMDDYRVDLEIFRGPMDLLLHLVKQNEVDICDIPIAKITDQYVQYLELLRMINIDVAADFLVTASTLMEIKSRMLLPRSELADGDQDDEDPRDELVRQLMEYKRFKDAARLLDERARVEADYFARLTDDRPSEAGAKEDLPLGNVELWDLLEAFGRLMRATMAAHPSNIVYDDTPIAVLMDRLLRKLREQGAKEKKRGALRDALKLDDDEILERMLELDLEPETLIALGLVPLVEVAWADGSIQTRERDAVLRAAGGRERQVFFQDFLCDQTLYVR